MLAAVILEGHGVNLHASAPVSIYRYVNSGPQSLFFALFGSLTGHFQSACILLVLLCTTSLLQFTSTFLASDLSFGLVVSESRANTTLLGMSSNNLNTSTQFYVPPYWQENPQGFQAFAEYQEAIALPDDADPDTIKDTGIVHRAFMPEPDHSTRTSIKKFDGQTTVLDTRMVCIQPQLHSDYALAYTNSTGWMLVGQLVPSHWVPGLVMAPVPALTAEPYTLSNVEYTLSSDNTTLVNLTNQYLMQLPSYVTDHNDEWSVREKLHVTGPGLVSTLDPRFDQITNENFTEFDYISPDGTLLSSQKYNMTNGLAQVNTLSYYMKGDPVKLLTGRGHVMLNYTYGTSKAQTFSEQLNQTEDSKLYITMNDTVNPLVITSEKEWLIFTMAQATAFRVAVTLCFDSIVSVTANVSAMTRSPLPEPSFTWDPSLRLAGTETLRGQIGVLQRPSIGSLNVSGRGLLELTTSVADLRSQVNQTFQASTDMGLRNSSKTPQEFLKIYVRDKYCWETTLCTKCALPADDPIAVVTVTVSGGTTQQIFQDVLRDLGEIHLAFQAYVFMLARSKFHLPD